MEGNLSIMRITIACPVELLEDAAQFSRATGYGPDDEYTFAHPSVYSDSEGNEYKVASGMVSPTYLNVANSELVEPSWGADMEAANRIQEIITLNTAATPYNVTAVVEEDVILALEILGLHLSG